MIDLDEFFGSNTPTVYEMELNADYSDKFLVLRFGADLLSDISVIREFYDFYEKNTEPHGDVELISMASSHLVKSGIFALNDTTYIHNDSVEVERYSKYAVFKTPFDTAIEQISAQPYDSSDLGFLIRADDFLIGFSTSWIVLYSPSKEWVDVLRNLASLSYGFVHEQNNEHGHLVMARTQDDLPTSFLAKAPLATVTYLPNTQKPKGWEDFIKEDVDLLNYNVHNMRNSLRFHVDIENAAIELSKIFSITGFSTRMKLVYHGVTAQRLRTNPLLWEAVYRETQREGTTLQSFVMDVEDIRPYIEENQDEILADASIFFGDGFAIGIYDRGVDFVFLKGSPNAHGEVWDALEELGYERENWWWEKPEEDADALDEDFTGVDMNAL